MFKLTKMRVVLQHWKGKHLPFACRGGSCAPTVGAPGVQVRQGKGVSQKSNHDIFSLSRGLDFGSLQMIQIWLSSSLAGL